MISVAVKLLSGLMLIQINHKACSLSHSYLFSFCFSLSVSVYFLYVLLSVCMLLISFRDIELLSYLNFPFLLLSLCLTQSYFASISSSIVLSIAVNLMP